MTKFFYGMVLLLLTTGPLAAQQQSEAWQEQMRRMQEEMRRSMEQLMQGMDGMPFLQMDTLLFREYNLEEGMPPSMPEGWGQDMEELMQSLLQNMQQWNGSGEWEEFFRQLPGSGGAPPEPGEPREPPKNAKKRRIYTL